VSLGLLAVPIAEGLMVRQVILLVAALWAASTEAPAVETPTAQELVARELPTVVSISILRSPAGATAAAAAAPRGRRFLGSGFILDPSGIILTNRHVIEGASDILVTLQDNTLLHGTLLAQADDIDLALIKIAAETKLPAVQFADSDNVKVAERVFAIGNPLGLGGSVTRGIISALNRNISDTPFDDYIQTDAAINHGNSGGPLFNERGEVVGMNTALFSPEATSGSIGLGFAIPANDVKYVADALLRRGGVHIGTLDFRIQQVTPEIADALNMSKAEGVIVGGTNEGGAASKCGIMAGDIILRYGDLAVKDVRALARAIARTQLGTKVGLRIWRNDEPIMIAATIQEMPHAAATPASRPSPAKGPGWHLASGPSGVVVTQIAGDGTAMEAGIVVGDVIVQMQQEKVADPNDVDRLLTAARQRQRHFVAMLVRRDTEGLRWLAMSLE
jgi:serine protease Do